MTTTRDDLEKRINSEELGEAREFTVGVPVDGMVDPTGEYPRRDYFFNSSINKAATGAEINNLWVGGSVYGINYTIQPQKASLYPFSQVNATPSGHVIEIDDTPGGERVLIKHETGAGIELKPDGSLIINSRKNTIQVSSGDQKVVIGGNGEFTYEGSLTLNVTGDYNVNVGGNYNVNAKSNYNEIVGDMKKVEVARTSSELVRGNKQTTIGGDDYKINLGKYTHAAKRGVENYINGEYVLHGDSDIRITSKNNFSVSAVNSSMVGEGIYVAGVEGTIGGEEVKHFGNVYTGPADGKGTQTTFYGSLVGKAVEAFTAEFAQKAVNADQAVRSGWATSAGQAPDGASSPTTLNGWVANMTMPWSVNQIAADRTPSAANVGLYLETSLNGIKDVVVDHDDGIEEKVNIRDNYFHYFRNEPSIHEIRSVLRSFNFRNLTDNQRACINTLIREGRLSRFFNNPNPPAINRFESVRGSGEYIGFNLLGNPLENRSKKFTVPRKGSNLNLNDPKYSKVVQRDWNKKFGSETKLSETVTLGQYLGSIGNPRSIDSISRDKTEQINLIDNLRKHAEIIDLVDNNPEFKDYRFVVTEGYGDVMPEVDWDFDVISKGKKTGEVAVYKLLNSAGKVDRKKTYDLAIYLKDHAKYDILILDYDTFDPSGLLSAQIVIRTLPDGGLMDYNVATFFNHYLCGAELIEIVPESLQ